MDPFDIYEKMLQMKQASIAADSSVSPHNRARAVGGVASDAAAIALTAENMLKCEDTTVVPAIARLVSEKEQKSFNTRVIRTLGLFDSRLHLVGMHEAILDSSAERKLFQETIPSIPQRMIPRWKRLLYDPRAGALDYV